MSVLLLHRNFDKCTLVKYLHTWLETRWVWLNISPWLNSWAALDLFAVLLFEDKVTSCPHFGWNVGMLNWSWLSSNLFETLLLVVAILHAKTIGNAPSNGYALEKMTKTYTDILFFVCLQKLSKTGKEFLWE